MPRPCIRIQGTGSGVGAVHKKANCERARNEANDRESFVRRPCIGRMRAEFYRSPASAGSGR